MGKGGAGAAKEAAGRQVAGFQSGIDELRAAFGQTTENIQPFVTAGLEQLGALAQGATAGGLSERLGDVFDTGIFGRLVDERTRAAQGQLAAGGLTRSGGALQEIAAIPTDVGLALEQLLTGRSEALAGRGQEAGVDLGGLSFNFANAIADLFVGQGGASASGVLGAQQAKSAGISRGLSTAAKIGSIFFSDPSLKENIEQISTIGPLNLYQWDWIAKTKGTMIENCGTVGFMADEVKELFPQHVGEFCGFMVIDYAALLDDVEATWSH